MLKRKFIGTSHTPGPNQLDLHGHGLRSALQATHNHLDAFEARGADRATLVTGRGLHSPNKVPVIRPAVDAFLDRNCYWREPNKNGGRFTVLLNAPLDD